VAGLSNLLINLFKVMRLKQIDDSKRKIPSEGVHRYGSSDASFTDRSSSPLPYDHPARQASEGRPPLPPNHPVYQAWQRGELGRTSDGPMAERTSSYRSTASVIKHSRKASRSNKGGDFFGMLVSLPVTLPLIAITMLTVVGSPIFLIVQSRSLYLEVASRLPRGPSGMWEALAVIIGPSLVVGLLIGRLILAKLADKSTLIGGGITMILSAGICLPILVNYWWHPLPNAAHMFYDVGNLIFAYSQNASAAYWMSPVTTVSIAAVSFGWALFAGQIRD